MLCCHYSIPVRSVLVARGLNLPTFSPLCNAPLESIEHVMRDCPFTRWFWNSFPSPMQSNLFYG
ncbi:hypothetical protein CFP56_012459 [Quercus suber]|uniref:Reverse transcriptase zinc-binding domain-containing protein n=1 Tax=Quercus suber TaxID=58331 RepID=A0AAW0KXV2_QUESU